MVSEPIERIAYLVRVNLAALATNLSRQLESSYDELSAARWLTKSALLKDIHGALGKTWEKSPFRQTDEWGVFYSDEAPETWLWPEEITSIEETEYVREKPSGLPRKLRKIA